MTFEIESAIAPDLEVASKDVRAVKIALNKLGYYIPDFQKGMSGGAEADFFDAIKSFQRAFLISVDGRIDPDDVTMRYLNDELEDPNNFMIFKGQYIWQTVGDEKVRGIHRIRDGRQYSWDDPPEGGHPGEDFGCRCWAEPILPTRPKGLNVGLSDLLSAAEIDAVQSSISPLDVLGGGIAIIKGGKVLLTNQANTQNGKLIFKKSRELVGSSARLLTTRFRDTKWIDKTPRRQIQKKFDAHKEVFGIKENRNNITLERFRKKLKEHVKSKDTIIIKGTYNKVEKMIHYYNPRTNINVMKDMKGEMRSGWKLRPKQQFHLLKDKNIGGGSGK